MPRRLILLVGLIAVALVATHLPLAPVEPANRDGITFAEGIASYDVTQWRPHWPGYPVTILAGKLIHYFVRDSFRALRLLDVLATGASTLPIAGLASRLAAERGDPRAPWIGLVAALGWFVLPASWLDGTESFSDPLALFLLLCALLALSAGRAMTAGLLAALTVGARLDYVFLLGPFGVRFVRETERRAAWRGLVAAVLGVATWWGWQLAMDGWGWFRAAGVFNQEYWSDWGGSSLTDDSAALRPLRLVRTFLRFPLGAWWPGEPALRMLPTALMAWIAAVGSARSWRTAILRDFALALGPYLAWIGFGHSVDLARYTLPLAVAFVVVAAQGLPRRPIVATVGTIGGLAAVLVIAVPLARRHVGLTPLAIQACRAIRAELDPARTTILISAPSPFLERYAAEYRTLRLDPATASAQVDAALREGQTLVATRDLLVGGHLAMRGWRPFGDYTVDPSVVSRGPWSLHLYVHDGESPAP